MLTKSNLFICFSFFFSVDPIECKTRNSVLKFFIDIFGEQGTTSDALLYESDRRLIVEIVSRELLDRPIIDEVNRKKKKRNFCSSSIDSVCFQNTTDYLSLLELILRNHSITSENCTRIEELQMTFRAHLYAEHCLKRNRFIINEILRSNPWLSTNDMPFYL